MFRCIIGENLLPPIPIARQICERFCYRLPLLIGLIAKSFTYQESPSDWEGLLNECTPWPQLNGFEDLYSVLESGYKLLGDQRKQKCFLYASLYPANSKIYTNHFVECCIAQGFLGDVGAATKYSAMRSCGIHVVLRHLVNVSFLEGDQQMRYVKMNDFYRQFALDISFKYWDLECSIYCADNEGHEKCSFRPESRQDARWISMVGSKKDCLPTNKNYWSLQTLLLQKNQKLVEIPPTYFDSMSNLLVLTLYGIKIRSLPSLSGLTRLKAFYLNLCSDLMIIPSQIQTLEHLEVFDIRDTGVNFVPCLESLRCLRISYILKSNYDGISELHKLEELTIEVKFLPQWCDDAENIIQQVDSLESLTTFKCNFLSPEITLRKFLEARKAPVDWAVALINCKPSPQVGVHGLSPIEARKMFEDIVKAKRVLPREEQSSSKPTNVTGGPISFLINP